MYKNNKRKIITAFLICAACVSITACNKEDKNSSSTSVVTDANIVSGSNSLTKSENDVTSIPEKDDDGNKVTVIAVTDEKGVTVTNKKGDAVTQLAVVDNSNNIITNAAGEPVKPNIKTTTKAESTQAANSSQAKEESQVETGTNPNGSEANYKFGSLLWMADYSKNDVTNADGSPTTNAEGLRSELVFNGTPENGEIFVVTFKVNDNAASGNYDIVLAKETESRSSSICNNKGVDLPANFYSGIIAVGSDKAPEIPGGREGLSVSLSNACAKPGETVTLYGTLSNNTTSVAALNTYLKYDSNTFTLESITAGSLIKGNGDFMTS